MPSVVEVLLGDQTVDLGKGRVDCVGGEKQAPGTLFVANVGAVVTFTTGWRLIGKAVLEPDRAGYDGVSKYQLRPHIDSFGAPLV